jgi:hypothetical protein
VRAINPTVFPARSTIAGSAAELRFRPAQAWRIPPVLRLNLNDKRYIYRYINPKSLKKLSLFSSLGELGSGAVY